MAQLFKSSPDQIGIVYEVNQRLIELDGSLLRVRGSGLFIAPSLEKDFERFQAVKTRHQSNDFRHSAAEMASVATIAQWSLDLNCELRNQPRVVVDFAGIL